MSKTLGSILSIGAAIAVLAIPGAGVFISGAIASAGIASGAAATALASAITISIASYGVQSTFSLLGLGPSMPKPDTTISAIKNPRPPRVSAYGRCRLYGATALPCSAAGYIDVGVAA